MSIKSAIQSTWSGKYLVSILHCVQSKVMPLIINDERAVRSYYKKITGKELNLENPQTFIEKMNWLKLNCRMPLMQQCADKYAVREYVIEKGYGNHLNKLLGVYDNVGDIDIVNLPDRFVLKATHGSHMNIIVKDNKKDINWKRQRKMMRSWLHQDIYWCAREWVYKDIPRRIIAEEYLEDKYGELRDYKFFCFNGVPTYFQYDIGRFKTKQYRNYYDIEKNVLPISDGADSLPEEKPDFTDEQFNLMKEMATVLSDPFQQVRVDFYLVNDKVYFGEMTFFDGGGSTIFKPDEWNYKFSEKWTIMR